MPRILAKLTGLSRFEAGKLAEKANENDKDDMKRRDLFKL
jgi:hypothetical protein